MVGRATAHRTVPIELVVFAVAAAVRLGLAVRSGGFLGTYGYDPSVYYAAADALVHGRVPYRDFVLLHPPGLMLVLTPFAGFGAAVGDHAGFVAANVAFSGLGAVNAVLVVRVAKRLRLPGRAALIGGLFYALWFGAVWSEYLARLEPLGNFCALLGLLALLAARDSPRATARWQLTVLGGAAFGAAAMVKIWWSAPLVAALLWVAIDRRRLRAVGQACAGAAGAMALIGGPFFALAPRQMLSMVVQDQLGRTSSYVLRTRLDDLTTVSQVAPHARGALVDVAIAAVSIGYGWLLVRGWRVTAARPVMALGVLQVAVLLASPSWFRFYADYAAVGVSLTVAAAAAAPGRRLSRRRSPRPSWQRSARPALALAPVAWVPLGYVAAVAVAVLVTLPSPPIEPYPAAAFAEATAGLRCVQSDSPMALIEIDHLSSDLSHGCRQWVDVTGMTYSGADRPHRLPDGRSSTRSTNAHWQHDLKRYLLSGQAVTILRGHNTGISAWLWHKLESGRRLAHHGGFSVFSVVSVLRGDRRSGA